MSLRPRYSLLAFLLFTAVIAVGTKFWRGPHHVVDRSNPQMEDEYTFYRDWDGTKIVNGVRLLRYSPMGQHERSSVYYYRQGHCMIAPKSIKADTEKQRLAIDALARSYPLLSAEELAQLQKHLLQELEQLNRSHED